MINNQPYSIYSSLKIMYMLTTKKRLMGASLLVFANKTDVGNCMTDEDIRQVCQIFASMTLDLTTLGSSIEFNQNTQMDNCSM